VDTKEAFESLERYSLGLQLVSREIIALKAWAAAVQHLPRLSFAKIQTPT
jgi:hypothetical protein